MAEKTVPTHRDRQQTLGKETTRTQERYITPPVDIYETRDGLVVMADLPGVSREGVHVQVDNNMLTIEGNSRSEAPGDAIYREYELVNFYRQFELTDKVDQPKISAELKHGVLTLTLPKAEEAKPREIRVRVG
jgi:HSP20 family molecular chaperone IbpA